ncbi:two-component sensory transduction protein RegX [soil metagenome]
MDTILLVEDEPALAESIQYNLQREGFKVILAADGATGLSRYRSERPNLILLDLMIPEISGFELCRMVRSESQVPIIVLTARDAESDKVLGLELGADDYVTKPFSIRELIARVRANLRRAALAGEESGVLVAGPVTIDVERHTVNARGAAVNLTPKEFAILHLLVERRGRLLTRGLILDEVWGPEFSGVPTTLDVHIRRLREKVEVDPTNPSLIRTVRGLGYKFVG